jgi:predicted nucleotidyltransferase component of viral defense system
MSDPIPIWPHEDPDLFRDAVTFTAAKTGFSAVLVEKDYFCTVLLKLLAEQERSLVFKGGTCLAKVYADFYRMSEDLDFTLPTAADASRGERSRRAATLKTALDRIERRPGWRVVAPFRGADDSAQYSAVLSYPSLLAIDGESIQVDVGLRELLLTPAVSGAARSLLLTPATGAPFAPTVNVSCLSFEEAMAEKLRAALTRREPAIRDFYDVDYAIRERNLVPDNKEMLNLLRQKLAVVRDPIDLSPGKLTVLQAQVETRLKAVVRPSDLEDFDLDETFETVARVTAALDSAQ